MEQFPLIDLFIDIFVSEPILLPTGDKVTGRQQYRCIVPKLYIQSKGALEDGRICRPKHVQQIQIDQ